jgi:hypothetical protein
MENIKQNESQSNVGSVREQVQEKPSILKKFPKKSEGKNMILLFLGAVLVVLAGLGTGYKLSGSSLSSKSASPEKTAPGAEKDATEAGVADPTAYPDEAEGMLVEGGMEGEGTHHLDRGAGENKNVYLTSTVIDLESFVGKKVKVWGETMAATKAPWLMDVGKIKVIE